MGEDGVHVVLGEEHADVPRAGDPGRELHQPRALLRRHAGGGLVHQQELRLGGQRDGEFDALHVAIGQLRRSAGPRRRACRRRRAARAPPRGGARSRRRRGSACGDGGRRAPSARSRRPSSRRRSARPGRCGRRPCARSRRDGRPVIASPARVTRAGVRLELPADHAEGGGLAGAVRADHGEHLAGGEGERDVLGGRHAAEALVEAIDDEKAHAGRARAGAAAPAHAAPQPLRPPRRCRAGRAAPWR